MVSAAGVSIGKGKAVSELDFLGVCRHGREHELGGHEAGDKSHRRPGNSCTKEVVL
jgi:hypothetical protein